MKISAVFCILLSDLPLCRRCIHKMCAKEMGRGAVSADAAVEYLRIVGEHQFCLSCQERNIIGRLAAVQNCIAAGEKILVPSGAQTAAHVAHIMLPNVQLLQLSGV